MSLLVIAANAVLLEVLWGRAAVRRLLGRGDEIPRWGRVAVVTQALVVLLMIAGTITYGVVRMRQAVFTPGPCVALVQGDVPQEARNDDSRAREAIMTYETLTRVAIAYHPGLIVWPETSYPGVYGDLAPGVAPDRLSAKCETYVRRGHRLCAEVHELWPTNVLVGLQSLVLGADGRERPYNSALLIDQHGEPAGRYDKIHLVPFGEYVPLRNTLPFMNKLAPYDFDYGVEEGQNHTRFSLMTRDSTRPFSFGVVICYEDTVPEVTTPYGGGGAATTDFVVNISNDGWFAGTSEHEEHLAICRFRAVECRRSVVRAVNMGVSAVIDGNGRVLSPQEVPQPEQLALLGGSPTSGSLSAFPWPALAFRHGPHVWAVPSGAAELPPSRWKEFKKTAGVLLAKVPIDGRTSFYARHGDWLPWMCWALLGAAVMLVLIRGDVRRQVPNQA